MYAFRYLPLVVFVLIGLLCCCRAYDYDLNSVSFCSEYEMLIVNTKQCVRRCPIACVGGVCFENGTCPCAGQYMGSCEEGLICAANCVPGCKEAGGYCVAPDLCVCRKGYYFDELQRRCRKFHRLLDPCRGRCIFGKCNYNGECVCAQGYEIRSTLLGPICSPICSTNCGPHAYCHMPNMCACKSKHAHYGRDGKCYKDYFE